MDYLKINNKKKINLRLIIYYGDLSYLFNIKFLINLFNYLI